MVIRGGGMNLEGSVVDGIFGNFGNLENLSSKFVLDCDN